MIGIVFYLEEKHSNLCSAFVGDVFSELLYDAKQLGATHCFIVDRTGKAHLYDHTDSEISLLIFDSLAEIEALYVNTTFVYLENAASFQAANVEYDDLSDYIHPDSCIYVSGPNTGIETIIDGKAGDFVTIAQVNDLWAKTALMIMLYDRQIV